jgi:hypothetical protein
MDGEGQPRRFGESVLCIGAVISSGLYCAVAHVGELLIGPTNRTDCKIIV